MNDGCSNSPAQRATQRSGRSWMETLWIYGKNADLEFEAREQAIARYDHPCASCPLKLAGLQALPSAIAF